MDQSVRAVANNGRTALASGLFVQSRSLVVRAHRSGAAVTAIIAAIVAAIIAAIVSSVVVTAVAVSR